METLTEIEPTREAIAQYLRDQWGGLGYGVRPDDISFVPYGFDARIDWNTFMITLDGKAVAFSDKPILPDPPESSSP